MSERGGLPSTGLETARVLALVHPAPDSSRMIGDAGPVAPMVERAGGPE